MDNGTLIIRSARKSLQGRYTCRAVNRIGQDLTATISISVHGTSISLFLYFLKVILPARISKEMFHIRAGKFKISTVNRRKIKRLNFRSNQLVVPSHPAVFLCRLAGPPVRESSLCIRLTQDNISVAGPGF
jgi:hypothetical protein